MFDVMIIKKNITLALALILFVGVVGGAEPEPDSEVEKQKQPEVPIESESLRADRAIAENLSSGEAKWLKESTSEFLGIFNAEKTGNAKGSFLILPAPGVSPNAAGAISTLAVKLSDKGWHSLAISMPDLKFSGPMPTFPEEQASSSEMATKADAKPETGNSTEDGAEPEITLPDSKKWYEKQQTDNMEKLLIRLLAAEAELRAYGGRYVILAQGVTAELILELISTNTIKPMALVTLNIQHPINSRNSLIPKNIAALKVPVLDIYNELGRNDAMKRKQLQKSKAYRQLYIAGSDINYLGSEQQLFNRISGWLKSIK